MVGSTITSQRGSKVPRQFAAAGQMSLTQSRSSYRSSSRPGSKTASNPAPQLASLPSMGEMSEFWSMCAAEAPTPAQKTRPSSPDPFAVCKVVTWKKMAQSRMAKDQRASRASEAYDRYTAYHRQSTDLAEKLPPAEDDDFSQRVTINPVTMEEMMVIPKPVSRERVEEAPPPQRVFKEEECSPNKAYMMKYGGFPGSSHIVGENAFLLMSSIY